MFHSFSSVTTEHHCHCIFHNSGSKYPTFILIRFSYGTFLQANPNKDFALQALAHTFHLSSSETQQAYSWGVFSSDFCSSWTGFYIQRVKTSFTHSFQCSLRICHCNLVFIALCRTAQNTGTCVKLFQHFSASGTFHTWSCSKGFLHNCFKGTLTEFSLLI